MFYHNEKKGVVIFELDDKYPELDKHKIVLHANFVFIFEGFINDCVVLKIIKNRMSYLTDTLMHELFPNVPTEHWNIINSSHVSIDNPETAMIWRLSL